MSLRGLHLHVDCASGAAGDMMLGAFLDLGVPLDVIGAALDAIGAGRQRLRVTRVMKRGIASVDIKVDTSGEIEGLSGHTHDHTHDHGPSRSPSPSPSPSPSTDSDSDNERTMSLRVDELEALVEQTAPHAPQPPPIPRADPYALVPHRAHPHARPRMHVHSHGAATHSQDHPEHHVHAPTTPGSHVHASATPGGSNGGHVHASATPGGSPGRHVHAPTTPGGSPGGHVHASAAPGGSPGGHVHASAAPGGSPAPGGHAHASPGQGGHAHDHRGSHAHYHYADIRRRIEAAPLTDGTRRRALDIFDRIARAEAKLHGSTVDEVSFHEVGAIDSVVDVVGTAAALDYLSPSSVTCVSVAMGHGELHCAHGVLPVPAPAALEVLREAGGVMADGGLPRELCTPTGAAILAHAVTTWGPAPVGKPIATGWGAGDAELDDRANALRVTVLELAARTADAVWQIEANIDDMSPELCAPAADAIFAAGALDVWWSPITMKKGRPALTLSALVTDEARAAVIAAVLRNTTTIGVRYTKVERTVLARRTVEVGTRYGTIPVKVSSDGDAVMNAAPEYEACAAAAATHGVPVKLVFAAALAAFDHGST